LTINTDPIINSNNNKQVPLKTYFLNKYEQLKVYKTKKEKNYFVCQVYFIYRLDLHNNLNIMFINMFKLI
jgi:hypothetical protein